jgi:hypothetical protein
MQVSSSLLLGVEYRGRVDNFPALYSGVHEFKSLPRDTLSCSDFRSSPQYCLASAEIILQIRPRPLPFTSLFTHRLTIRRYIVSDADTFVKQTINKKYELIIHIFPSSVKALFTLQPYMSRPFRPELQKIPARVHCTVQVCILERRTCTPHHTVAGRVRSPSPPQ